MSALAFIATLIEAFLSLFLVISLAISIIAQILVLPAILVRLAQGKFKTSVLCGFLWRILYGIVITGVLTVVVLVFHHYASRWLVKLAPDYLYSSVWIRHFVDGEPLFLGAWIGVLIVLALFAFSFFDKHAENMFSSILKDYDEKYAKSNHQIV